MLRGDFGGIVLRRFGMTGMMACIQMRWESMKETKGGRTKQSIDTSWTFALT